MKKIITFGLLVMLTFGSGCASMYAYNGSKDRLVRDYANAKGEPDLFVSYKNGDVQGIGIDISAMNVVTYDAKAMGAQVLGAVVDVGVGYGIYEGVKAIDDAIDGGSDRSGYNTGSTVINIDDSTGNEISIDIVGDNQQTQEENNR